MLTVNNQSYRDFKTIFSSSSSTFSKVEKSRLLLVIASQLGLALLDLVGVALVGLLGALSLRGVQSLEPGERAQGALNLFHLDRFSFQTQVALLGMAAALVLVSRTIISVILTRRVLYFLARRGSSMSEVLVRKMVSQPLLTLQENGQFQNLFAVTTGVSNLILGVMGTAIVLVGDLAILGVLGVGLFIVDPVMAIGTIVFFVCVGYLLFKIMHKKANNLGEREANLNIESNSEILELLSSYREVVVKNRRAYYAREISATRSRLSLVLAELQFMPNVSKYVIEGTLVIGALLISAVQFMTQDATRAIATLAIFLAAGTRIAPAVLRIQQGAVQMNRSFGASRPTLALLHSLREINPIPDVSNEVEYVHDGFKPEVEMRNVSFTYPSNDSPTIRNVNLTIKPGSVVAIVGPSGAGKSTLADLLLGIIEPNLGEVLISGESPEKAIETWPGAIAYVSQDSIVATGTISTNISLGFPPQRDYGALFTDAINLAQLSEFISELPNKELTQVGDAGSSLSGGQRQRIGIARAMFTKPKLLVLDEATSSLDGETESNISEAVKTLRGDVTVVMIAHRLSTVREADVVIYFENGSVVAVGNFEEVRALVPNFDSQAKMMGL